jgi:uncharacterized glyoxalase superfamily protein PhnB
VTTETTQHVIPYLFYANASEALDFLVDAFGFEEISAARDDEGTVWTAKLRAGHGVVMIGPGIEGFGSRPIADHEWATHRVYCYVDDVDAHFDRAKARGAAIRSEPEQHFGGDRIYVASDIGGHQWIFATPGVP